MFLRNVLSQFFVVKILIRKLNCLHLLSFEQFRPRASSKVGLQTKMYRKLAANFAEKCIE